MDIVNEKMDILKKKLGIPIVIKGDRNQVIDNWKSKNPNLVERKENNTGGKKKKSKKRSRKSKKRSRKRSSKRKIRKISRTIN